MRRRTGSPNRLKALRGIRFTSDHLRGLSLALSHDTAQLKDLPRRSSL